MIRKKMMKTYLLEILIKRIRVKIVLFTIITCTLAIALSPMPAAYASAGDLDGTFGTNGQVLTGFTGNAVGNALVVQPDGKIVVVGEDDNDFGVARYNSNGILDTTFGSSGKNKHRLL